MYGEFPVQQRVPLTNQVETLRIKEEMLRKMIFP